MRFATSEAHTLIRYDKGTSTQVHNHFGIKKRKEKENKQKKTHPKNPTKKATPKTQTLRYLPIFKMQTGLE